MSRTADKATKIHLLQAAEAVFAERGLALAKVEEITRRAGTSKGAFYLHFESKEEAFEQVVESFLARLASTLPRAPALDAPVESPAESLVVWRASDRDTYDLLWQNRAIVSIIQGCQGDHVYLAEAFRREMHARTAEWIEYRKRTGHFRDDTDTDLAATLVLGAYNEMATKMLASPVKPPIADWVTKAQAVFVRGFGTPTLVRALDDEENPALSKSIERRAVGAIAPRSRPKVNG